MRCDQTGCRSLAARAGWALDLSPDGRRLVFATLDKRGAVVSVMDSDGNRVRELTETDTACRAGWASNETLWVSRRRAGKIVWVEINADSGRETSHIVSGSRDCMDGEPDPQSPVRQDLRVVPKQTSQLRFLGKEHLGRH